MRTKIFSVLFMVGVVFGSWQLGHLLLGSPDMGLAILTALPFALVTCWIIIKGKQDHRFLVKLFLFALLVRCVIAFIIHAKNLQMYFGADATTYDIVGNVVRLFWQNGGQTPSQYIVSYTSTGRPGWGMFYFVAYIYYLIGPNQLALQLINCVFGAATCVAVYKIAMMVYPEQRVARIAAVMIALSPSMILWSSQLLKDAPTVLSLALCALYALKLRTNLSVKSLLILLVSMVCLYSLRHYAFYIMFVAIAGSLVFAAKRFTPGRILQGGVLILVIGMTLAYFGAGNIPQENLDLKRLQATREWGAKAANSGFGGDVDISDPQAALAFLPIGLLYVLFAPFPWMITNVRQLITLPELIAWWIFVPMLVKGYWHAVRHRLKDFFAICVFTVGLTLIYALFQSNVGTAYRHRSQLYIFFFIFISIGLELRRAAKLKRSMARAFPGAPVAPAMTVTPLPATPGNAVRSQTL